MQDTDFRRATCSAEVDTGSIRLESHNGRDHLVAPVVAVREMVLKGEFLPAEEIANSVPAWNGRVLPIGHPTNDSGEFVSANSPAVHDEQGVGTFFEADQAEDGSLVGEVWVDVETSKRLAAENSEERFVKPLAILASHAEGIDAANMTEELPPALDAASNVGEDDILEVSTAYFYRQKQAMGTHNGEKYEATQHNIRPDHLALLPNSVGECSAADGCGAPRVHVHANVAADAAGDGAEDADFAATPNGQQQSITNFAAMSDEIEWLASHTAFDRETLESWDEDHLSTLRTSVEHDHDANCQCGGSASGQAQDDTSNDSDSDSDSGGDDGAPAALQEELSTLRDEVESLREQQNAERQQQAQEEAKRIATHAEKFDDTDAVFDALGEDPETLGMLADEFESKAAAASADFGGRVGANDSPGSDDDADDYLALAKKANETRFGSPEAGD